MPSAFRKELVTTEAKVIASYNSARKLLSITNESENIIYISKDPQNIVENGFPIYPFETLIFDVADGDEPEYAFYAQTKEGSANVRIYENLVM
ncbi:MAG: hypothetical protein QXD86_05890 [Candidatus Bathyarchaeia archaeon]